MIDDPDKISLSALELKLGKIDSLTGIRGIAATWVILFHCMGGGQSTSNLWWLNNFAERGGTAVDMFFVLSGFIMAFVYGEKMSRFTFKAMREFLWRRFARIYPAHFAVLMLFLAVVVLAIITKAPYTAEFHTVPKFFYQLFLLNGIGIPDSNGWNFPSWTISSEFVAYLFFPFIILWTTRLSSINSILAIIGIYGTMFGLAFWINGGQSYYLPWSLIVTRIGSQFTVGCLLYNLSSLPLIRKTASWLAPLLCILVLAISVLFTHEMVIGAMALLYAVLILAIANDHSSLLNTFLSSRPMVFLGDISYSVYIIHNFTLILLNQTTNRVHFLHETLLHGSILRFVADLAFAIIGGAFLHLWLEVPARRWLTTGGLGSRLWRKNGSPSKSNNVNQ